MRKGIIYFLAFGSQRVLVCRDREFVMLRFLDFRAKNIALVDCHSAG